MSSRSLQNSLISKRNMRICLCQKSVFSRQMLYFLVWHVEYVCRNSFQIISVMSVMLLPYGRVNKYCALFICIACPAMAIMIEKEWWRRVVREEILCCNCKITIFDWFVQYLIMRISSKIAWFIDGYVFLIRHYRLQTPSSRAESNEEYRRNMLVIFEIFQDKKHPLGVDDTAHLSYVQKNSETSQKMSEIFWKVSENFWKKSEFLGATLGEFIWHPLML